MSSFLFLSNVSAARLPDTTVGLYTGQRRDIWISAGVGRHRGRPEVVQIHVQ